MDGPVAAGKADMSDNRSGIALGRDEDDGVDEYLPEDLMAIHIGELIESYEAEDDSDNAFYLDVTMADGRRFCLPYVEHSSGGIVLMDDTIKPPRKRLLAMQYVVDVAVDPDCNPAVGVRTNSLPCWAVGGTSH